MIQRLLIGEIAEIIRHIFFFFCVSPYKEMIHRNNRWQTGSGDQFFLYYYARYIVGYSSYIKVHFFFLSFFFCCLFFQFFKIFSTRTQSRSIKDTNKATQDDKVFLLLPPPPLHRPHITQHCGSVDDVTRPPVVVCTQEEEWDDDGVFEGLDMRRYIW